MKIIIAGTRTLYPDSEVFDIALEDLGFNFERDEVIQGGASGVDRCAKEYCESMGVSYTEYKADWDDISKPDAIIRYRNGKPYNAKAGSDRNALMAQDGDILLLIWDGKSPGSKNMKAQMKALGKKVHEIIIEE